MLLPRGHVEPGQSDLLSASQDLESPEQRRALHDPADTTDDCKHASLAAIDATADTHDVVVSDLLPRFR